MTDSSVFPSLFGPQKGGRRVLICIRGNCAHPDLGQALYRRLLELIGQYGLDDPTDPQHIICHTVHCLGVCKGGPIMTVHPEGVRYHRLTEAAIEEIFHQHLRQDRPVTAYQLPRPNLPV